eukprot:TRINITY_DN9345_c0_g1::TRINITY_DN9345_c0_g1_i1::g.28362::m.28362 TRINITY_DN9345_c0_g1::TRINITY_DN9345_c0_g1_i1::g.28362  ORF type:complete len:404 (+),score=87.14,sp/P97443/SMYD1_MOUSE/43.21/5e-08,zf-MYND/PF01753.13/9.4e-12,zf-Mss51/PF13824.1/6.3e+03,zf-Mss51/PF13824.1/2.6 TRINITY_DN9345_c0_g1_i1:93-1214(+)
MTTEPEKPPTPAEVLDLILTQMLDPPAGVPQHRPTTIGFPDPILVQKLSKPLQSLGIEVIELSEADGLERFVREYSKLLIDKAVATSTEASEAPGLLSVSGVTPQRVGKVFEAATEFYSLAPWDKAHEIQALAVRTISGEGGIPSDVTRYISIVGSGNGPVRGVAVFETLRQFNARYLPTLPEDIQAAYKRTLTPVRRCGACGKPGEDLKRCTGCKLISYCGGECQKKDWTQHRKECPKLKDGSMSPESISRMCWEEREWTCLFSEGVGVSYDDHEAIEKHHWRLPHHATAPYPNPLVHSTVRPDTKPSVDDLRMFESVLRSMVKYFAKLQFPSLPKNPIDTEECIEVETCDGTVVIGVRYIGVLESQLKNLR